MKKSIIAIIFVSAIFCAGLGLQSCAETSYGETPYVTTTTTYTPYGTRTYAYGPEYYSYYGPGYYPSYETDYYTPYHYSSYPSYPTYYSEHDSVVGATAHAVGTVIAAPFRIVGDVFDTIL